MNAELQQLTDSARQVVSGNGLAADEESSWSLIAELGWFMVATPEELGGLAMGPVATCTLQMELGGGLATVPFLPQMLAVDAVVHGGLAEREAWLEPMMAGTLRVTAALGESDVVAADSADGGVRLNGSASAIPSLDRAGYVLVTTRDEDCVALVPLDKPGITASFRPTWDTTRRLFELRLADVSLPGSRVLARGAEAQALCRRLAIQRDFGLAADAVGGAQALLQMTVDYLRTREQFGRPLALFQALKHRCADLKALAEGARALLQSSLDAARDGAGQLRVEQVVEYEACAAKQLGCSAYATVAEESLQLHGGIGMTQEHDCHLFLKRALLNEHLGGHHDRYDVGLAGQYLNATSTV